MNKRYIDFVPTGKAKAASSAKPKPTTVRREVSEPRVIKAEPKSKPTVPKKTGVAFNEEPLLGVIEETKRPIEQKADKTETKKSVEKSVEKPAKKPVESTVYRVPKAQFINQEKVVKRPLSKNFYPKKVEEPKEEQGPVTIITKPEKDSRAGLVIAIIIIIILGAAAGTVAFLLLPK